MDASSCDAAKFYAKAPLKQPHNVNKWSKMILHCTYLNLDSSSSSIPKPQNVFWAFQILVFVLKLSTILTELVLDSHIYSFLACAHPMHSSILYSMINMGMLFTGFHQIFAVVSSSQILICNYGCLIEIKKGELLSII